MSKQQPTFKQRVYLQEVLSRQETPRDLMLRYIHKNIENFEWWFNPVYKFKSEGDVGEYDRLIKQKYDELLGIDNK